MFTASTTEAMNQQQKCHMKSYYIEDNGAGNFEDCESEKEGGIMKIRN